MPDRRTFLRLLAGAVVAAVASPVVALLPATPVLPLAAVSEPISIRMVEQYNITTDARPCRMDVLYGFAVVRPNLACRISA